MIIKRSIINILLVTATCCAVIIIVIFIWRRVTMPKNVFEEIYKVELQQSEKNQNTILSDTKYFEMKKATIEKQKSGGFILEESSAPDSPYNLQIGHNVDGGGLHKKESKNVIVNISYVYKTIIFSVQYRYLFDGGGGDPSVYGEGLHISWEASKDNEMISSISLSYNKKGYAKTLKEWDITESEIESSMENELQSFFEIWFSVYQRSQFSKNNLGNYEQVE